MPEAVLARLRRSGAASPAPSHADYLKGAALGLAAAAIWGGWSVLTRLAVTTRLDAADVAALRFGVAGLLLAPVVMRRGLARERLGWHGLAALVTGGGAPFVLLAAGGLRFAPAYEQSALNAGLMPVFVAAIGAIALGERPSRPQRRGLTLILLGALFILGGHEAGWTSRRGLGDAFFLAASFLWAGFTVIMRRARLAPLHAAALVATGSLVLYLPLYLALCGLRLAALPTATLALQAIYQGALVTIVSLLLYGRALTLLGAAGGAAFGALVPALAALFAIPLLSEWPSAADWLAMLLFGAGVYLASGGRLPAHSAPCGLSRLLRARRRFASRGR